MMKRRVPVAVALALIGALAIPVETAQQPKQPPPPQRAQGTISEGVTAVLVDIVVRDRRGQPVRDLTQADVEVLEDGVPQAIGSFSAVFDGAMTAATGAAAPAAAAAAAPATGAPPPVNVGPGMTALVFQGLSSEGRRRAVQASQSYVGTKEETPNYIGIFNIDLSLTPLVPFTRNGLAVRKALDTMARGGSASFKNLEQQQQKASADERAAAAERSAAAGIAAGGPGAAGAVGGSPGEAQLAQMQSSMLQGFANMESDQQGYSAVNGLFAIINTLGRLPGRKSLILFSEGLSVPEAVNRLFLSVIDSANRANVSIYALDAAGLRAESEQAKVRDMVNAAGRIGVETGYSADSGDIATVGQIEANENSHRSDPAMVLGRLTRDTGGLLFNSTNNLRPAFDRVENDLRNYYLLGYTPSNDKYDGRFRTIEVKVKRSGLTVAARKGYFAVRDPGGAPVNEWEAPALGALEQKPVGNAFPVRAGALLFPERGRPGLVPVVVELKTAPLTFQAAADGINYTSDFTVLVRFLDDRNMVVRKVSQHYEVRGPLAEIERAKQGDVIFYRESELPPGIYMMEAVVYDAPSGKSSVRFSTIEMPKHEEGKLRASSLMLVKGSDLVPAQDRRADHPLIVKDTVLHPNLGDAVSKAAKELGFYFALYPAPGGPAPESSIELLQNGKFIAQLPMPVAAADASGRIQQVGRLPLDQLAPGTYELRAVVKQGATQVIRSTVVRIVE